MLSKAFYGLDLAAGWLSGCPCPSCHRRNNPVKTSKHLVDAIRECQDCGVYYRPTAIAKGKLARLYYDRFYTGAGLATDFASNATVECRMAAMKLEGKDRTGLIRRLLGDLHPCAESICVFGCSWGYEMTTLQSLGLPVFGIELSDVRRQLAIDKFGLEVYASVDQAAGRHQKPLVMSSHVLEHIPEITETLNAIQKHLTPVGQVHITPSVHVNERDTRAVIGREHVLGVTRGFWRTYAARYNGTVQFWVGEEIEGAGRGELVALLQPCR